MVDVALQVQFLPLSSLVVVNCSTDRPAVLVT